MWGQVLKYKICMLKSDNSRPLLLKYGEGKV